LRVQGYSKVKNFDPKPEFCIQNLWHTSPI